MCVTLTVHVSDVSLYETGQVIGLKSTLTSPSVGDSRKLEPIEASSTRQPSTVSPSLHCDAASAVVHIDLTQTATPTDNAGSDAAHMSSQIVTTLQIRMQDVHRTLVLRMWYVHQLVEKQLISHFIFVDYRCCICSASKTLAAAVEQIELQYAALQLHSSTSAPESILEVRSVFPRQVYTKSHYANTLAELGLSPNAVIIARLLKKQ